MLISHKESPQRTVLGNPYLLTEIFEVLQDTPPALCAAALTCRAFRKPAQDVVWRWMDFDLLPVIRLIGNVVFVPSGLDVGVGCWCLNGPITPSDISKITHLGTRVRHITNFHSHPLGTITLSTYVALAAALPSPLLFPNLRTLHLELRPPFFTIIMHLLQSSRLVSVEIPGPCALIDGLVPLICDISTFVQNIAPSDTLKRLNLATSPNPETLATIPKFRNLRSLQLNMSMGSTVPHAFLHEISQLESLEELNFDGASFGFTLQQRNAGLEFPVLTKFLVSSSLEDLTHLFSFAKFPVLYDLTFEFLLPQEFPQSHNYDWAQFLDALYSATSTDHFKELYVLPCPDIPYNARRLVEAFTNSYAGVLFDAIASSLLQFKLTYLSLNFPFFDTYSKDDLKRLMQAFPGLTTLDLRCASKSSVDTSIFEFISTLLPALKHLTLDICSYDTIAPPPDKISSHKLETLGVRFFGLDKSDVRKVMEMGIVVDAVFPYLRELRDVDREGAGLWDDEDEGDDGAGAGAVGVGAGAGAGGLGAGAGVAAGAGQGTGVGRGGAGEAVWNAIKGLQYSRLVERKRQGLVEDQKDKGKDKEGGGWVIDMRALDSASEEEGGDEAEGKEGEQARTMAIRSRAGCGRGIVFEEDRMVDRQWSAEWMERRSLGGGAEEWAMALEWEIRPRNVVRLEPVTRQGLVKDDKEKETGKAKRRKERTGSEKEGGEEGRKEEGKEDGIEAHIVSDLVPLTNFGIGIGRYGCVYEQSTINHTLDTALDLWVDGRRQTETCYRADYQWIVPKNVVGVVTIIDQYIVPNRTSCGHKI
ncbi:hypothetical protein BJ165DRAFT_1401339 [Panaeolus papilionaceus]|nr:hypothetical protein BJ165DRAFT_1401339 [Panaeolus papilionaceus]